MSDDDKRKELLEVLRDAEQTHAGLQEEAQRIAADAQSARDTARVTRDIVSSPVPLPAEQIAQLKSSWQQQNDAARAVRHDLRESRAVYGSTLSSTVVTSTSTAAFSLDQALASGMIYPAVQRAAEHYTTVTKRDDAQEKLRAALERCGLDRQHGDRRSALSLLDESALAIAQPSSTETAPTVLVPLRQAIEAAIAELLRRSPGQESASNWKEKVLSIGARAGRAQLPGGYFDRLGALAAQNINELSGGKDRAMPRELVLVKYYAGLQFFTTLLDGIDEAKLRS